MVSFTLVCEKEIIENRRKKIDDSGFITRYFFSPANSGNPFLPAPIAIGRHKRLERIAGLASENHQNYFENWIKCKKK